jgi:DNA-binding Xre family transcriptional regulator
MKFFPEKKQKAELGWKKLIHVGKYMYFCVMNSTKPSAQDGNVVLNGLIWQIETQGHKKSELARQLKVDRKTLDRILNGESEMTLSRLEKLCDMLELKVMLVSRHCIIQEREK